MPTTQTLAEISPDMLTTQAAELVEELGAPGSVNHHGFVATGRSADRQFCTELFTARPGLNATMADLINAGNHVVGRSPTATPVGAPSMRFPTGHSIDRRAIDICPVDERMWVDTGRSRT